MDRSRQVEESVERAEGSVCNAEDSAGVEETVGQVEEKVGVHENVGVNDIVTGFDESTGVDDAAARQIPVVGSVRGATEVSGADESAQEEAESNVEDGRVGGVECNA
ncbi:hypothetical protein Pcinc_007182 [Petrolisthes cinctipes]|uniref:Uncharacterized protein n=1 Tax=Petrolisthes cinctipes TaxID=88211 RepID=A0AAE1GFS1_PETCI|nr:hypothetical protein Pcinc_007182 [Petrolisthes cinctipes]